jgi:hypothetical protein
MKQSLKKKRTKRSKTQTKKPKIETLEKKMFHFYDDLKHNFQGVAFSDDDKTMQQMCTGNIVCHKVKGSHDRETYSKQEVKLLLRRYLSSISNAAMRKFIKYQHVKYSSDSDPFPYFDPNAGLSQEDFYFLSNPNLRDVVVGFDMDLTLHQFGYFQNIPTKELVATLSELTRSIIKVEDIGEMYFGGKARFDKCKSMFSNLAKTIGMQNVYIITSNPSSLLTKILPDLYSTLFQVKFVSENLKVTTDNKSKFDFIHEILPNK